MGMYDKNKSHHINLRLSQVEYEFLTYQADLCGMTVSEYLRSLINSIRIKKAEVVTYENKQTHIYNKL